jgi:hypothetical protein
MLNTKINQPLLLLATLLLCVTATHAFQAPTKPRGSLLTPSTRMQPLAPLLRMAGESPEDTSKSILDRIIYPRIDDRGLPLSDAFVAQIIGPSLQVFWLTAVAAPRPTWLVPIFDKAFFQFRGAFLVPTLVHGAGLACCWLLGVLVARGYEEDAIDPTIDGYSTVLWRIFQAGCFATGCLILSTQIDLLLEYGRYVQPGESPEIDARILAAEVEVLNDIFFEILALLPMRLYLAYQIEKNKV